MSCLGGTTKEPRIWYRYYPDGRDERTDGRVCNRTEPWQQHTSRRSCAACPAFRGLRWDGTVADGLGTDRLSPFGLSPDEHRRYQEAVEQQIYDDETWLMEVWYARQERELVTRPDGTHQILPGIGQRGLRMVGDDDALERDAAKSRAWRQAHPGADQRKRKRAAYMRAYRLRRNPS